MPDLRALTSWWLLAAVSATWVTPTARADSLTVPAGGEIQLDGRIDSSEWSDALVLTLSDDGGSVRFLHDGSYLYAGVTVDSGYPHLAAMSPASVWILHASAALGAVQYEPRDSVQWERQNEFVWELRDTSLSNEARAQRAAYLEAHGWVASTNEMGRPGETEFKVHLELFDHMPLKVAIVAGSPWTNPHFWPATLNDGARNVDLFLGSPPEQLTFAAAGWASLWLGPMDKP